MTGQNSKRLSKIAKRTVDTNETGATMSAVPSPQRSAAPSPGPGAFSPGSTASHEMKPDMKKMAIKITGPTIDIVHQRVTTFKMTAPSKGIRLQSISVQQTGETYLAVLQVLVSKTFVGQWQEDQLRFLQAALRRAPSRRDYLTYLSMQDSNREARKRQIVQAAMLLAAVAVRHITRRKILLWKVCSKSLTAHMKGHKQFHIMAQKRAAGRTISRICRGSLIKPFTLRPPAPKLKDMTKKRRKVEPPVLPSSPLRPMASPDPNDSEDFVRPSNSTMATTHGVLTDSHLGEVAITVETIRPKTPDPNVVAAQRKATAEEAASYDAAQLSKAAVSSATRQAAVAHWAAEAEAAETTHNAVAAGLSYADAPPPTVNASADHNYGEPELMEDVFANEDAFGSDVEGSEHKFGSPSTQVRQQQQTSNSGEVANDSENDIDSSYPALPTTQHHGRGGAQGGDTQGVANGDEDHVDIDALVDNFHEDMEDAQIRLPTPEIADYGGDPGPRARPATKERSVGDDERDMDSDVSSQPGEGATDGWKWQQSLLEAESDTLRARKLLVELKMAEVLMKRTRTHAQRQRGRLTWSDEREYLRNDARRLVSKAMTGPGAVVVEAALDSDRGHGHQGDRGHGHHGGGTFAEYATTDGSPVRNGSGSGSGGARLEPRPPPNQHARGGGGRARPHRGRTGGRHVSPERKDGQVPGLNLGPIKKGSRAPLGRGSMSARGPQAASYGDFGYDASVRSSHGGHGAHTSRARGVLMESLTKAASLEQEVMMRLQHVRGWGIH